MIDPPVKNTCNASIASKGFCHKATNGIKRHLAVDTLGFPSSLTVPKPTSLTTRDWLRCSRTISTISKPNPWIFPRLQFCRSRLSSRNNQPSTARNLSPDPDQIRFERSPKPSKLLAQGKSGFVATRWVVERSNVWWNAVPGQNFEWTLDHARLNSIFALSGSCLSA